MSWDNKQKCPTLDRHGIHINQSAYSLSGQGQQMTLTKRNRVKKLCLFCRRKVCVYVGKEDGNGIH